MHFKEDPTLEMQWCTSSQLKILVEIWQFLGRNRARMGAQVCSCAGGASASRGRHVRFYL